MWLEEAWAHGHTERQHAHRRDVKVRPGQIHAQKWPAPSIRQPGKRALDVARCPGALLVRQRAPIVPRGNAVEDLEDAPVCVAAVLGINFRGKILAHTLDEG